MIWLGWVLWHINHCRLFNAKSFLYINRIALRAMAMQGYSIFPKVPALESLSQIYFSVIYRRHFGEMVSDPVQRYSQCILQMMRLKEQGKRWQWPRPYIREMTYSCNKKEENDASALRTALTSQLNDWIDIHKREMKFKESEIEISTWIM